MGINVAGHMVRKSITKDTSGNIINMIDEKDGGWIVKNRQIVNQDKWNELVQKEADKREAAKAATEAIGVSPELSALRNKTGVTIEDLNSAKSTDEDRIDRLEKKVDEKFDAILKLLQK